MEKDPLWAETGDGGDVSEEALVVMRTLVTATGHDVPVSEKGYVEFLRSFDTEMQATRRESQARIA